MKSPLVLCLTNTVAANFTANVLLAIGAKPAMIEERTEAAELAAAADAVLVNVGTLTPDQANVIRAAVRVCQEQSKPWVLDPVACHILTYRRRFVEELLLSKPSIIRGNHAEIEFLLGPVPKNSALRGSVPMLSTGETDRIYGTEGDLVSVSGGVSMLQTVTATGCAQGAICAAFLGWGQAPSKACLSASQLMKKAGERALGHATGPGTFQAALLDALYALRGEFV